MKKPTPKKPGGLPPIGDTVASGNRMSKENAKDMKAVKKFARGGKVKKYAEGGMMGAGLELEAAARRGEMERELGRQDFSTPKAEAPAKKQSFSEAFAAARKRGDKTFKWNGGTYGTKMKGEGDKPAAKPAAKKAESSKPAAPAKTSTVSRAVDKLSRPARAINRAVGSIQSQMDIQSRNMAAARKRNPDLITRLMEASNPYKKAKGGAVKARKKKYV